jgi:iron complex transport system ATP-binding protein
VDPAQGKKGGVLVMDRRKRVLEVKSVSATYGGVNVLRNISLGVRQGEILGVVGPNGAGKTTLIKVLSGVLKASAGSVMISQQDISSFSPASRARLVAVVPQARQLGGAFSVRQTVLLGRTPYLGFLGNPGEADMLKVEWAMQQTAVEDLADRKLAEISGGEQQRVLLARALAQDAAVLLLDEPTNHLDLKYQVDLLHLLKYLVKQEKLTVLMAMHDLNQVSGVADRILLLVGGQVFAAGKPEDVLTPDNIRQAYQTEVMTFHHPQSGKHMIITRE